MGRVLWRTRYVVLLCLKSPIVSATYTYLQESHAATAMAILKDFGLGSLVDGLIAADGVHDLGNILSLSPDMHSHFDELSMWFEATDMVCYWQTSQWYEPDVCTAKLLQCLLPLPVGEERSSACCIPSATWGSFYCHILFTWYRCMAS